MKTADMISKAAKGAFKKIHHQLGTTSDSDLVLYISLTSEDIEAIKDKYGSDGLMSYIKKMEMKSMKEKRNAN